jgi:alkanesulfonate monooxygenase SsuD/methylene tetrahydromethanopterin reductase-like flavin-dependent oxidoreductase (luciferase family)
MTPRRGVGLTPMETRREIIVEAAVLAEELGYETFAVPEGWGLDSTPIVTEIALRTNTLRLTSAILSVWGRTPATLAMTATTLQEVSQGRYALGLGASTQALAEGFHDTPFDRPAQRLREVVTQVRALLDGEPVRLRRVPDARPLKLNRPPEPGVPIWIAALGARTTRVAADLGDGWIPALVARDRLASWASELAPKRPFTVASGPIAVANDDPAVARDVAAACAAWYLTAMGGVYARSVSGQGYAEQVDAIVAANPRPSPSRAVVPPSAQPLLDQLAVYGTGGQVSEQVAAWDGVADIATILLPPGLPWPMIEATLRAAAPTRRPSGRPVGAELVSDAALSASVAAAPR